MTSTQIKALEKTLKDAVSLYGEDVVNIIKSAVYEAGGDINLVQTAYKNL